MKKTVLFLILFSFIVTAQARAESFIGKVISITDGNNFSVACGDKAKQVKMLGVDCPDLDQHYGPEARDYLLNLTGNREVWVDVIRLDHSNRCVSKVTLNGQDLRVLIVLSGFGWYDSRYASSAEIAEAQAQAQASKSGLWSENNPVPPWEFRQMSRGIIPNVKSGTVNVHSSGTDWGVVPLKDQTCNSAFGIHVLSTPTVRWGPYYNSTVRSGWRRF
jgi:endonuclease YncB( thermonuclease family)